MKQSPIVPLKWDNDDFAWKLANHLVEDLKPFDPNAVHAAEEAFASRNVEKLRGLVCDVKLTNHQPYALKISYQLSELFKKYQFQHDLHTSQEILDLSKNKFFENQKRLLNFRIPESGEDLTVDSILFGARGYVDQILGYFDPLEIMSEATFGKKSSVGISMRKACEGQRYEAPITGSLEHIDWFKHSYSCFNRPAYLYAERRAVLFSKPLFKSIDRLDAVLVDKTWKSKRMIMPNTTIGTLYSGGLGRVLEGRLRSYGYDIKTLQSVHGELAKFGSLTGSLVTADQSMASDNITVQLVDRIFSSKWAHALKFGRIQRISLYGDEIDSPTFSTMGIGFTFPLQTIVFLSLLLAIRDHLSLDEQTVISVFGDDLIYDERMHTTVCYVFPLLGLVLNAEKTFATGEFRESCGHDYYRGIDVRPFFLGKGLPQDAGRRRIEAYLYKTFNGLTRRWNPLEIPATLSFIFELIASLRGSNPLRAPDDFPDTAGIHTLNGLIELDWTNGCWERGVFKANVLTFEADVRREDRHDPYYFLALKAQSTIVGYRRESRTTEGVMLHEKPPIFEWEKDMQRPTFRSEMTGKRYRHLFATIPEQDRGRYRERRGVIGNWTP